METNIKVIGFSNKRINGKTLDNKGFDLDYDGNYLDVNAFDNNHQYYTRLDNQDIMHLLNVPSSQIPLEQRIMQFNVDRYNKPMSRMHTLTHGDNYDSYFNQIHKPNQMIMYYKPKSRHLRTRNKTMSRRMVKTNHKTKRLSLTHRPRQKTRKMTYARVSSLKPISSYKHSRKSKPISSIRQTIY